jgi:hypothetical protein
MASLRLFGTSGSRSRVPLRIRPALEELECRLCPSAPPPYIYFTAAQTGNTVYTPGANGTPIGTLTNVSLASINDSGQVGFLGFFSNGSGVDEWDAAAPNPLTNLSFAPSTNRNYTFPQIDASGDMIAQDAFGTTYFIRIWQQNGKGAISYNNHPYNAKGTNGTSVVLPTISPDGTKYAYFQDVSGQLTLYIGDSATATNTVVPYTFPAHSGGLRPMIANNGAVVVRAGGTNTDPIMQFQIGQPDVTIADPAYFNTIGANPGIDASGTVVTFYGDLNSAGAGYLTGVNNTIPGLNFTPLTPGPGIFASIAFGNQRGVVRLAGVSGDGHLDPGETWVNNTDSGPFSSFVDARVMPTARFDSNGNLVSVDVVFMAADTTSNANQGIYTNRIIFSSGVVITYNPLEVVNSGDTLPGLGQVTNPSVYAPMNAAHQVALVVNTASGQAVVVANPLDYIPSTQQQPNSYTPSQISHAYGIDQIPAFTGPQGQQITPDGAGQTIAIIDAYDDPNIITDLAQFDQTFFPNLGSPTLTVYNEAGKDITALIATPGQNGVPGLDSTGAAESEEALDVEWAHAIAPGANIDLVEANSLSYTDLGTGMRNEVTMRPNVAVVSISIGGGEFAAEQQDDKYFAPSFKNPRITFIASSGDEGSPGDYPAISPNVMGVGGTTLYLNTDNSYQSEDGWGGSGGSESAPPVPGLPEKQPSYQAGVVPKMYTARTTPDVAFDGDPRTGVQYYDSYGSPPNPWQTNAGTSLGAPCWAGLIAIADEGRVIAGRNPLSGPTQTLPALYSLAGTDFNDVTTGNNAQYTLTSSNQARFSCATGYDLVTGLGSPKANLLIPDLVAYKPKPPGHSPTLRTPGRPSGETPANPGEPAVPQGQGGFAVPLSLASLTDLVPQADLLRLAQGSAPFSPAISATPAGSLPPLSVVRLPLQDQVLLRAFLSQADGLAEDPFLTTQRTGDDTTEEDLSLQ